MNDPSRVQRPMPIIGMRPPLGHARQDVGPRRYLGATTVHMPHDPLLEQRLADALAAVGAKAEPKKMFGGISFMVDGHMAVGVTNKGDLMVRFAPDRHEEIKKWPGAKPMTFGKAGMRGFLFVDPATVGTARTLSRWVDLALEHVSTLPKKAVKKTAVIKASAKAAKKALPAKAAAKKH
jgi:TfoX/Sxy family transcriptional regulator of competence genes